MRLDAANARIGARRARLLGGAGLRALLARPSPEAQLAALRANAAGASLPSGALDLPAIETALRERLREEGDEIVAAVEGRRARARLVAWIGLDEAEAVKAIVRGLLLGASPEEVLASAPVTPHLPAPVLRAAAGAASVAEGLEILAASGSAAAKAGGLAWAPWAGHPRGAQAGLVEVELAADRAAFGRAFAAARGLEEDAQLLRAHLADRVDARNARTLLLGVSAPGASFLPGGRRLSPEGLASLAALDPAELRAALANAFRIPAAALAHPALAEVALESVLLRPLRREARNRPLSLAVPLAYLAERRAEVRRAALAIRGTALGLAGDDLLSLVEGGVR